MESIIIAVLWATCSLLVMIQYAPFCQDMPAADYLLAGLILLLVVLSLRLPMCLKHY